VNHVFVDDTIIPHTICT